MEPASLTDAPRDQERAEEDQPLISRYYTDGITHPFDDVTWVLRDAWPEDSPWHMKDVSAPDFWSQQAVDITAKLYLNRSETNGETSVRQLIRRVTERITREGMKAGYFGRVEVTRIIEIKGLPVDLDYFSADDPAKIFYDELCYICLHQMATFNSPVWFNIGRDDRPQCPSACFLLGVEDTTEDIMRWARDEAFIFKSGSGSSANISKLRGAGEAMSTGGTSSGPVSFMRLPNAVAETVKSGGTTRRAARMVQMDVDHLDIEDFISCKPREEARLRILAEAGVDLGMGVEGERNMAELTSYQSANNSVRVTSEFMRAATDPVGTRSWHLVPRKGGRNKIVAADELLDKMSQAAWECADPGLIFHDTVNSWHTTPDDGPIRVSNACSEVHTPDDSSCNLSALNAVRFLEDDGDLKIDDVRHVVDVMTTAMDILVEFCELPTDKLTERTKRFRWLGIGASNIGAAIMSKGLAYDSDGGRDFAASLMALITGRCYRMSTILASRVGPFEGWEANADSMIGVIARHRSKVNDKIMDEPWVSARYDWRDAHEVGTDKGFRNAQASVIAPNGTTSFFMDCDTTGIEPAFSLVQYKTLAGGGSMVLVNGCVTRALRALGYDRQDADDAVEVLERGEFESFMSLVKPEHWDVFAGANDISADGHIRMIAAVQPFISGASSKTINLPSNATPSDIRRCFVQAWELGVKCIAVYRDGSKARQVLSTKKAEVKDDSEFECEMILLERETERIKNSPSPVVMGSEKLSIPMLADRLLPLEVAPKTRRRLPRTRTSRTHKIHVRSTMGEHEGYVSAGMYADGTIGEMFLEGFGRSGGFVSNALAAWATAFSIAVQYGTPWDVLARKHVGHSDETGGMVVPDPEGTPLVIRSCDSIVDYIARWLIAEFGDVDLQEEMGVMTDAVKARKMIGEVSTVTPTSWDGVEADPASDIKRLVEDMPSNLDLAIHYGVQMRSTNGHKPSIEITAHPCPECRSPMQRTGSCMMCMSCAYHTGCG